MERLNDNSLPESTRMVADDPSEDLSDIGDAEIIGYLNNRKEILLKKMIWEARNKEYPKGRQQVKSSVKRKTDAAKKTAPAASKVTVENKKRPSSKINYDALTELLDSEEASKGAKLEKAPGSDLSTKSRGSGRSAGMASDKKPFDIGTTKGTVESNEDFGNTNEHDKEIHDSGEDYGHWCLGIEDEEGDYNFGEDYDYSEF